MFILRSIVLSVVSLAVMFGITKLLGNRQLSQMNIFDYINGITIGSIAAELAVADSYKDAVIEFSSLLIYGLAVFGISVLTIHSSGAKRMFSGKTLMLIDNGKLYPQNLKTAKIEINELMSYARINGYFDLTQVRYAILESNGSISFLPYSDLRPATPKDLGINVAAEFPPIVAILDGQVKEKNLKHSGNNAKWLLNQLAEQGYSSPSKVFLATIDQNNKLKIFPNEQKEDDKDYFN